jgi:NAD(P)-dependent dehydrogenase (short-subunit alcohol dehydrogenase family)
MMATHRREIDGNHLKKEAKDPERLIPVILDVTNENQIETAVQLVRDHLKKNNLRFVGLINNAGYGESGPTELFSKERMVRQFDGKLL